MSEQDLPVIGKDESKISVMRKFNWGVYKELVRKAAEKKDDTLFDNVAVNIGEYYIKHRVVDPLYNEAFVPLFPFSVTDDLIKATQQKIDGEIEKLTNRILELQTEKSNWDEFKEKHFEDKES